MLELFVQDLLQPVTSLAVSGMRTRIRIRRSTESGKYLPINDSFATGKPLENPDSWAKELDEEFDVLLGSGLPKLLAALKAEAEGTRTGFGMDHRTL